MNIQYLREFLAFQSHMNLTAAAKKLFISQPTLSSHIASLERDLGVELIEHGRSITLTQAGRTLAEEAPHLIEAHDAVAEKCRNAALNGSTLAIARNHGTRSCNEDNFDILLSGFISAHPEVFVHDLTWDDETCLPALSAREADCVSSNFMPAPADVEQGVRFVQTPNYVQGRFCLWVDETHPLAARASVAWDEVSPLKLVFSTSQRLAGANVRNFFEAHGISFESRSTPEFGWSYMRAIKPGEVLVLDTGFVDYESLKMFPDRRLVPITGPDSECVLHIAYLEDNDNRALRAFLDYIEQQKAEPGYRRA